MQKLTATGSSQIFPMGVLFTPNALHALSIGSATMVWAKPIRDTHKWIYR
ncbi:hypothetical protein ACRRVA_03475 [Candidatus Cardinium hertigii]|nr:hypothetical protein [Cardinium endosymbiont of Encarsia pergandiella]